MPSYQFQTPPAHVSRQQAERICVAAEKAGHLAHVIFTGPPTPDVSGDYDGARAPYRRVSLEEALAHCIEVQMSLTQDLTSSLDGEKR